MTEHKNWLLDCVPRAVQLEAISRSWDGWKLRDGRDEEERPVRIHGGQATGWGHFMEMRLGKTPTILNEFQLYRRDTQVSAFVGWVPNSFKAGWLEEAEKLGVDAPFIMYDSTKHDKVVAEIAKMKGGHFGLIVNHEAAKAEKTQELVAEICKVRATFMTIDESIAIKNPTSLQTKAMMDAGKDAFATRCATGLPFTQGVQDLYPQLRFMRRLQGSNFYSFRNRYCKMGGFKAKKVVGVREENAEQLQNILFTSSFVAKRREWGSITEPQYSIERVQMSPEQTKAYKEMDEDFYTVLADEQTEVTADLVLTKLAKLQQIASGFVYVEGKEHRLIDPRKIPKMTRMQEILENEVEGKAIVVYNYKSSLDNLREALAEYNPAVIGSKHWMEKNEVDVQAEKARFNGDPGCRVCLVAFKPGKYGHTLIGTPEHRCATTLFYENTYSLDDRIQIEARNTMDQQDWVNLYADFVGGPVELEAIKALQRKENVVTAVLGHYGLTERVRYEG